MRNRLQAYRYFILGLLLLGLTACGFHLRGNIKVPPALQRIYILSATPYGDFEQALRRELRAYHIHVVDSPSQANTILQISNSQLSQDAGATSADLQTRQFTLTYKVSYQLLAPNKDVILPSLTAYSTTTFTAQLSQMVASSNTPSEYKTSLENDVIFRMINLLLATDSQQKIHQYFAKHPR